MPLVAAAAKTALLSKIDTLMGPAADATKREKFAEAIASWLVDYVTANAVVQMANNGVDTNGDTLVTNQGTVT